MTAVRVRDLRTGAPRGERLGGTLAVEAVAVGELDGTPIAVTGDRDGTVRVWDLRAGKARGEPLRGHGRWIDAVAVREVDGTPIAVTGGRYGLRVWDLRAGGRTAAPGLAVQATDDRGFMRWRSGR